MCWLKIIIDQIYALNPNFSDATLTMDSWNSVNIKTTEAAKLFKNWQMNNSFRFNLSSWKSSPNAKLKLIYAAIYETLIIFFF